MQKYGVLLLAVATTSPRAKRNKKKQEWRDPKTKNGRGDETWDAGRNFGRETKFRPVRDAIGRIGAETEARRTWAAREGVPAREGASPSYGLRFGSPWPSRDLTHHRVHSTGTGARK
jgi:hypothetical protein